jgi:guanylate kinase
MTVMKGNIYIFSGPSGAGKSSIIKDLMAGVAGLAYSISHTSRPPRHNETNGIDYHFVSESTFRRMIDEGAFVEWAKVYDHLYGTSAEELRSQTEKGTDVILDIDSQGAKNIRTCFKDSILIYILPPSLETLEQRLRSRATDSADVIDGRYKKAVSDLINCEWYDYLIINDDLWKAVSEVKAIILSSRCSNSRMLPMVKKMLGI